MDLELRGKRAIVTGGSQGIGKAIARALALEGASVAVVARTREPLEAAAAEIARETGSPVVAIPADTSKNESVRAMVDAAFAHLGGVDILVNCAGQPSSEGAWPKLAEITDELFWADVNVKVMGYLRCIREVTPHMARQHEGRIINISGLAARSSTAGLVTTMRNVSVAALTKHVADDLGKDGITAVVVHPGTTWTEKTADLVRGRAARLGTTAEEVERRIAGRNSIGRVITAAEVADVVTFLASPKAVIVNGDAVAVGGGQPGAIYF